MIEPVVQLTFAEGTLRTIGPGVLPHNWKRPADLAAARLACVPPPAALEIETGADALAAAFKVLPFARFPWPAPTFGCAVTPAARAAFALLASDALSSDFRVLRGEVDDFLVFARRQGACWMAGALTVSETALTFRFEDLWQWLPEDLRRTEYAVDVVRDNLSRPSAACLETLSGVAPDARIMLDLAASGGFTLTFRPAA